jgi:tetratricopeptide (TPR) repeat protein
MARATPPGKHVSQEVQRKLADEQAERSREASLARRRAANDLATAGAAAFQEGKFDVASERFEEAYALLPVPTLALWAGRAFEKLGRLVLAEERFREALSLPVDDNESRRLRAVQEQARADALREHRNLVPRIPRLRIKLSSGVDAGGIFLAGQSTLDQISVSIDGQVVDRRLLDTDHLVDPGEHVVAATLWSGLLEEQITIFEGETRIVEVSVRELFDASGGDPELKRRNQAVLEEAERTTAEAQAAHAHEIRRTMAQARLRTNEQMLDAEYQRATITFRVRRAMLLAFGTPIFVASVVFLVRSIRDLTNGGDAHLALALTLPLTLVSGIGISYAIFMPRPRPPGADGRGEAHGHGLSVSGTF